MDLEKKLGIKEGMRVILDDPEAILYSLLHFTDLEQQGSKNYDYIHIFCKEYNELEQKFRDALEKLDPNGMLWVSWPKKSSKSKRDLNENIIRELGLELGVVDVKVCSINETWSGLKFVYRLKDRHSLKDVALFNSDKGVPLPIELYNALAENPAALQKFNKYPPSHQKEYASYVAEAKKPETREKRARKTVEMLVKS